MTLDTRSNGSGGQSRFVIFHGEGESAFMNGGGFRGSIPPRVRVESRT